MSSQSNTLVSLAKQADILVAHHAIPEQAGVIARRLHMPPSVIGQIAATVEVKQLLLSHRMNRSIGLEQASTVQIRRTYNVPMYYTDDLQFFRP